jgi:hypothetical protein
LVRRASAVFVSCVQFVDLSIARLTMGAGAFACRLASLRMHQD